MKFVLTQAVCPEGMRMLEDAAEVVVANAPDPNGYLDLMNDADAIIVRIASCDGHVIENSPNLKVIGRTGVGYDSVDVKKATELGIPVVITPGANSRSVAEHTVAFMFALAKNLCESQDGMKKGNWKIRDAGKAIELEGKTVGIIGLGHIGCIVGDISRAIGMETIAYDPVLDKDTIEGRGCRYCGSLEQLLSAADFITVHVPLIPSTANMISMKELSLMKESAFLINSSRGGIVNERDLVEALRNGVIAGAALDAFCEEPPSAGNPLLSCPNLIITPHSAAQTKEAVVKMARMCIEGCLAVLNGRKWPYVADKSVYDHPRWNGADWA